MFQLNLIKQKFLAEFQKELNCKDDCDFYGKKRIGIDDSKNSFTMKFVKSLLKFVHSKSAFVYRIFEKLPRDKLHSFYHELFKSVLAEYKAKIVHEFVG